MSKENFKFQAEVGKILNIVANSIYSEKYFREYISNASDACDKLRYESLQKYKLRNTEDLKFLSLKKINQLLFLIMALEWKKKS